ncbi:hypothetical protein HELRODRAFT_173143 [Helobdella robusta]|uniref:Uncharacterized protein n=1 Tax=Helobdella robusta TaxID=6412 RepID=T1F6G2_HELRO|nr:hypothetical protein HELRODRAFT_173143 [Helobdella robusta]ESO04069.1 hypothetical protein HELRODRAFT_173143 [Helobdella robusta]
MATTPCFDFIDLLRPHDLPHGGIIVFFRNNIHFYRNELPTTSPFEALAMKFRINGINVVLLAVYRPGSAPIFSQFFSELKKRGTLNLIATSKEFPVSNIKVSPHGIYLDHCLIQALLLKFDAV